MRLKTALFTHRFSSESPAMSLPRTLGELQLYRVLQRAHLLPYYNTFIQQGGDDVQQLSEAGEEEFLEIMSLVGMATKPLHVRRLQKALQEWVVNPAVFNQPLASVPLSSFSASKLINASSRESKKRPVSSSRGATPAKQGKHLQSFSTASARSISPNSPSDGRENFSVQFSGEECQPPEPDSSVPGNDPTSPRESPTQLDLDTAQTITDSVRHTMKTFPKSYHDEFLKLNKKFAKSVGLIFRTDDNNNPAKEEDNRKSGGRSEWKRGNSRQLSKYELTSNEATAPFCRVDSNLLIGRVDFLSLARLVAQRQARLNSDEVHGPTVKNMKLEHQLESDLKHAMLIQSQTELIKHQRKASAGSRCNKEEDTGSLFRDSLSGQMEEAESGEYLKGN
ncbi:NGFI-A-binding protein 2-like isoform X1 [Chiloscyllium plagiosum]|uniref:NGFI-A-binding protein 2-like isoform X1 n=2 Tax=Chiloscyllium plagiosum TaxID=36176 RepID=UPI001CB7C620|nr:NGFI-A-binding protein 2-like isoform X1 [Chiloscyllium plagiosum]